LIESERYLNWADLETSENQHGRITICAEFPFGDPGFGRFQAIFSQIAWLI
jgi:hypothetical protein